MGEAAPAEHIIATIVATSGAYFVPLLIPFISRFPARVLSRAVLVSSMLSAIAMAVFSNRAPFDAMHPRRYFIVHMENVRSLSASTSRARR